MAKFYGKLKTLSKSLESKPLIPITKQKRNETPFLIRGDDRCIPVWHYILVPSNKIIDLNSQRTGEIIDWTTFGCVIKYRDDRNEIIPMSGWGTDPPESIKIWFDKHFDYTTFDDNTTINYEFDDIRLCTMQRLTPNQMIGIYRLYHKQDHFHYIILSDENDQSTLAYRSGIRDFDRFISLNGINIEQETSDQITERFNNQLHLPVQMLVCSPATYQHYKLINQNIHADLPTVQHLKPVFDISLTNENISINLVEEFFYVVRWENSDTICIVSQSSIFKSPEFTQINDICFIETENQYRRGQINFKGSKQQCQNFRIHFITQLCHNTIDRYSFDHKSNDDTSICKPNTNTKNLSNKIFLNKTSRFEDLPNELLFDLFKYLTIKDLHDAFVDLNCRFKNLVLSCYNMSFHLDENTNPFLIKLYGFEIAHLTIDTFNHCDFQQFSNLYSLILRNRSVNHIKQIRPEIFPKLVHLSFLLNSDFKAPVELINDVFSNRFPYLRYANLGRIDKPSFKSWSISSSLIFVSIRCNNFMIFPDILSSCPNLKHFQFHILHHSSIVTVPSSLFIHSLERFTLWSDELYLSLDLIDNLLRYIPNVKHLYLQTECRISFIQLIENVVNRLNNLSRFDCFIKELMIRNQRIGHLNNIHQIASYFNRIQCIKETDDFRIFATY